MTASLPAEHHPACYPSDPVEALAFFRNALALPTGGTPPIPATSELVLEGFIDIDEIVPEGPFGEWTGYYAGGRETAPIMDIRNILHRNDPIITGCSPARRGDE